MEDLMGLHGPFMSWFAAQYHWQLSLLTGSAILALVFVSNQLARLVPSFREARRLNHDAFASRMQKPAYSANQSVNRKWGIVYLAVIFGMIIPFCVTLTPQPWWRIPRDCLIILMFYDFFYYLTHRFLFHDAGFLGGPLIHIHAVHHRQHNPCRSDSSYIHPLEVAIGLGLYA